MQENKKVFEEEIDVLMKELDYYSIEYPSKEEIDKCVENLRCYVPERKSIGDIFKRVLRRLEIEVGYIDKLYWLANILIFLAVFKYIMQLDVNPYGVIALISPLPLILGMVEVSKSRENNMLELELSFKISAKELIISRIIVIGVFNIILNTFMCILLFKSGLEVQLLKINIFWLVPFVWVNLIAFLIAQNVRGYYSSLGAIALWVIVVSLLFNDKQFVAKIMNINEGIYIGIILVGLYLQFLLFKNYLKTEVRFFCFEK